MRKFPRIQKIGGKSTCKTGWPVGRAPINIIHNIYAVTVVRARKLIQTGLFC